MTNVIVAIIIGAIAGWLASLIMKTKGGLLRNIILGVIGGVVGSFVLGLVGISGSGFLGNILVSLVGACIVVAVGKFIFK